MIERASAVHGGGKVNEEGADGKSVSESRKSSEKERFLQKRSRSIPA